MKIEMLPSARREMLKAARWYDRKAAGLGDQLLDEVRDAIVALKKPPVVSSKIGTAYRRKLLDVFPYSVVYRVDGEVTTIVAVAHFKRRPGYWRKRLRSLNQ